MNIVHVVENMNRGGLERIVIELIRAQTERGHRCRVACLFEEGILAGELRAIGVEVVACGKRDGIDFGAIRRLRGAVRDHRADVLHTHNPVAHYYAVLASLGLGVRRTLNTRHGMGAAEHDSRRERMFRLAMRRTDFAVAVCAAARGEYVARDLVPAAKACVIPNGIRLEQLEARGAARAAELRRELGFAPDTRIVGTVGRLNWSKSHETLIDAVRLLSGADPALRLVLVGGGEREAELRRHARGLEGVVAFLGDRDDVPRLLAGLDVFALSSVTEGYSVALLEAAASALPIVATRVGGNPEIVRDGETGLLVPAGDPARLAAAIGRLLAAPDEAARLGAAAREWACREASFRAMAERYEALYAA